MPFVKSEAMFDSLHLLGHWQLALRYWVLLESRRIIDDFGDCYES